MFDYIYNKIVEYDTIIVTRHHKPDLDALGSQFGLQRIILDNFKNKTVYVTGDMSRTSFLGEMDQIDDSVYENALLLVTDVSVTNMIAPVPYNKAKEVICIDHHKNECDIPNAKAYYNRSAAAACQIIVEFAKAKNLSISKDAAKALFSGIISDTNRFNFSLTKELFESVSSLIEAGVDYQSIYETMYSDSVKNVKMRAYFVDKFVVEDNFAYLINKEDVFEKFPVDTFTISRGMVNVMSNLREVDVWANFTIDMKTNKVLCEFRSKKLEILPIAIKYGGGGHLLACGCTVENFNIVQDIIKDFKELLNKEN